MIPISARLEKKIFHKDAKSSPIRSGFGQGLKEAGEQDDRVVALCADLTDSTKTSVFKKEFNDRFFEMGIGEQSMASVAAGMSAMGKIPFFASYAMFSPGRNWEQIRTTICYNNSNAKIVGAHAGVSVGQDGGTHQAIEDIAITRVIPRMNVIVPCDYEEARKATIDASKIVGPVYLRLQREATPMITTGNTPFEVGKVGVFWKDKDPDVLIISCGALTHNALLAARVLKENGVSSIVLNCHTIKPLDKSIVKYAEMTGCVVTVEEHQKIGGLGSAVSELLSEEYPSPVVKIGVDDKFGQSGDPDVLIKYYNLDVCDIVNAAKKSISMKISNIR